MYESRHTFRNIVRNLQSMGGVLERDEGYEFYEFAKLCYIVDRVLGRLDVLADFLCEL